jgi:hypothetical protein
VLSAYPVILLAGDIEFDPGLLDALTRALRNGSRVLLSVRHQKTLGAEFEVLNRQGKIEVLEPWINPQTRRGTAISDQALRRITKKFLPMEVTGDPIQYQVNRTENGWVVELVNNRGVIKKPDRAAMIDPQAVAHVTLKAANRCASAIEWRSRRKHERPRQIELTLAPGTSEFVELNDR